MMRQLLTVFFSLFAIVFSAQAQKATDEEKATKQAEIITKYINSKFTDEAQHLSAEQTASIKDAYATYYSDTKAYKKRKKEFMASYKEWKAAASKKGVSPEEAEKLKEQKVEIAKENKALNKEREAKRTRREDKIKEALNEEQLAVFVQMREEQSKDEDEEESK